MLADAFGKQPPCQVLIEDDLGVWRAGTYGMKLSADSRTIYVIFNGHLSDSTRRPAHLKPNGFGLTSFAAIHLAAD